VKMRSKEGVLLALIGLLTPSITPAQAQNTTMCVSAGRVNEAGQWAPQLAGVQMLDAQGKVLRGAPDAVLPQLKQISVSKPLPLSACHASATPLPELKEAAASRREKSQHLMASAQPIEVGAVYRPSLRSGGSLIEIQVLAPQARIAMR
jgi:hypothetical protein